MRPIDRGHPSTTRWYDKNFFGYYARGAEEEVYDRRTGALEWLPGAGAIRDAVAARFSDPTVRVATCAE